MLFGLVVGGQCHKVFAKILPAMRCDKIVAVGNTTFRILFLFGILMVEGFTAARGSAAIRGYACYRILLIYIINLVYNLYANFARH